MKRAFLYVKKSSQVLQIFLSLKLKGVVAKEFFWESFNTPLCRWGNEAELPEFLAMHRTPPVFSDWRPKCLIFAPFSPNQMC